MFIFLFRLLILLKLQL